VATEDHASSSSDRPSPGCKGRLALFVWYYKINDELRRAESDEGISPMRSLMAMIFG
jgi:hypothetical protein